MVKSASVSGGVRFSLSLTQWERNKEVASFWALLIQAASLIQYPNAARTFGLTESTEVLGLDLGDFFRISKTGKYRVEFRSESLRDEEGKPGVLAGTFTLVP